MSWFGRSIDENTKQNIRQQIARLFGKEGYNLASTHNMRGDSYLVFMKKDFPDVKIKSDGFNENLDIQIILTNNGLTCDSKNCYKWIQENIAKDYGDVILNKGGLKSRRRRNNKRKSNRRRKSSKRTSSKSFFF
jgi:hypothetical protein